MLGGTSICPNILKNAFNIQYILLYNIQHLIKNIKKIYISHRYKKLAVTGILPAKNNSIMRNIL